MHHTLFKLGYFTAIITLKEVYRNEDVPADNLFFELIKWIEREERNNCDRIEWDYAQQLVKEIQEKHGKNCTLSPV